MLYPPRKREAKIFAAPNMKKSLFFFSSTLNIDCPKFTIVAEHKVIKSPPIEATIGYFYSSVNIDYLLFAIS